MDGAIFDAEAAVLHVSMELMGHPIRRRLVVPLDMKFQDFHQIFQIAFGWHDYHLHEFYQYDESETDKFQSRQTNRQKLNIVMDEEAFEYANDVEMILEEGLLLSDFIPSHTFIKYVYDFGDNWRHDIIVEEILTKQNLSSPIYLAGEGTAPHEDCGGEPGFNAFLGIMNDPSHDEHDSMKAWARMQLYREFDIN